MSGLNEIMEWVKENWDNSWNDLTPEQVFEELNEESKDSYDFHQPLEDILKEDMPLSK